MIPISEEDIRKSLIVEAKRRKYWSTKTIAKMTFDEIEQSKCYHVNFKLLQQLILYFIKIYFFGYVFGTSKFL